MLKDFQFLMPTKVVMGEGKINTLPDEVKATGAKKILIVTDKGVRKAGIVDKTIDVLNDAGYNDIFIYDNVAPNPRTTEVNEGCEFAKKNNAEIIIAIGGGSAIDTAKGIGTLMTNGGEISDYEGYDTINEPLPPFIAVPTTVGTGSEATQFAVITDLKRKFKLSVADEKMFPNVAILDPNFVATLPSMIIASTGMDALSHAIESYICKIATPVADAIALYAIELISKNIREAVYGDDIEPKANLQLASMMGGMALSQADIAGVHCMGEALGGIYDMPHGIANASVLPYVMAFSCVSDMEKYANVAKYLGVDTRDMSKREAAMASAYAVKELNDDLMIPTIKEAGAKESDFEALAEKAEANISNPSNPRAANKDDYLILFKKAFAGEL